MKVINAIRKGTREVLDELRWINQYKLIKSAQNDIIKDVDERTSAVELEITELEIQLTKIESKDQAIELLKKIAQKRVALKGHQALADEVKSEFEHLESDAKNLDVE